MDHERPVAEVDPRGGRWVYEKGASKDAGTAGSSLKGRISGESPPSLYHILPSPSA
jgi:hypothetical protein